MMTPEETTKARPAYVIQKRDVDEVKKERETPGQRQSMVIFEVINRWPNSDTWPFRFLTPLAALSTAATGFFFNKTVRNYLYLQHIGRVTSYFSVLAFPALAVGLVQNIFVTWYIVDKKIHCPVCIQMRSAMIQLTLGGVYPLVFAPIANYSFASRMKDINLPKILKEPMSLYKFTKKMYKPHKGIILGLLGAHFVYGAGLAYLQQDCFFNVVLPVLEGKETFVKPPKHLAINTTKEQ